MDKVCEKILMQCRNVGKVVEAAGGNVHGSGGGVAFNGNGTHGTANGKGNGNGNDHEGSATAFHGNSGHGAIEIGAAIRHLRQERGRRAVEVAKVAGIDPRTLAAIETGRIRNPSIENLGSIAHALEISVAHFFVLAEQGPGGGIYFGNQKGEYAFEFSEFGLRLISFTPMVRDFFIGKMMVRGMGRIEFESLPVPLHIFVQMVMGRLKVKIGDKEFFVKEGDHLLFNGALPYAFFNDSIKECSFFLVTAPSFLTCFERVHGGGGVS